MTAGKHDFIIEKGASFQRVITWSDDLGDPINLTGYSANMQVRTSVTADDIEIELTDQNGKIVLGGTLGTITLSIADEDTATLNAGTFLYDLNLISSGGQTTRLIEGNIHIRHGVTK